MNRNKIYWLCQVFGWFLFVLLNSVFVQLRDGLTTEISVGLFTTLLLGIGLSHLFRNLIIKYDWLRLNPLKLIPRFLFTAIVISVIHHGLQAIVEISFFHNMDTWTNLVNLFAGILNVAFVYIVWSLIYFLVHFVENYKKEEIKNLKWEASKNEFELNRFISQLNPHFMFNSMNSIRALIDEDPYKAKDAITQLSNILRNTLLMGRKKIVRLEDELSVVKDYLNLEVTRYEERLLVEFDIEEAICDVHVPPLMLQTIVENGIKHGVSKLVGGGRIKISAHLTDDSLRLAVINSGQLDSSKALDTGYGLRNTIQRLSLLYGEKAVFSICNLNNNEVISEIILPIEYEGSNH